MNNKTPIPNKTVSKIKHINNSISLMTDCVKHLEKMRSFNYVYSVNEEDLKQILDQLHQIEESLEKIQSPETPNQGTNSLLKAIGKDRKLWVTKPKHHNNTPQENSKDIKPEPQISLNPHFSKTKNSY